MSKACIKFLIVVSIVSHAITAYSQQSAISIPLLPSIPGPSLPSTNPLSIGPSQSNRLIIEQDMRDYELQRQKQANDLKQAYKTLGVEETVTSETSPSLKVDHHYPLNRAFGRRHFDKAFQEISSMLDRKIPYDLKRAVFLTEWAYDTTLNYQQFERQVSKLTSIIQLELQQKKISPNDNLGKIMAAFKFMADTLRVRNSTLEKTITTYPKTYDFEDFYGMQDYHKMFVTKLVRTGKGQCHSLPLLFLILCQEIGAHAYLSFSPEHSYVKFIDDNGNLNNIELTNQMFTSDQFILQSGYVTSAAIKSKIYMDTLGPRNVINYTLNDLANSYVKKYGYDDLVLRISNSVIQNDPRSIQAYMNIANYYNVLGHKIELQYKKLGTPRQFYFTQDQEFRATVKKAIEYGNLIDNLGFAQMPPEMYSKWLGSLKDESMRQQHIERKRILSSMTEF